MSSGRPQCRSAARSGFACDASRVSALLDGHAKVQRGDDYELGVSQRFGSREFRVSGYQESVSNTTLTIASPEAGLFAGDLLPNLFSNSASFDMGRFETFGYTASVTQDLGDNYKVTVLYGSVGVVSPAGSEIPGESCLRSSQDPRCEPPARR